MVLSQKWPYFQLFFQAIQARIMSFTIFQNEETPFQSVKTISSKSIKIDIFPKGLAHGFCPKNEHISNFFFSGNMGQDNNFYDILERINAILGYKKKSLNGQKIVILPKGLTHCFCPKIAIFSTFFFQAIQARIMSFTIFQNEITPFQAVKTIRSTSIKFDIFPKGLAHGFCPKISISPTFFLGNMGKDNVFYDILEQKNAVLGCKKNKFEKFKN